MAKGSTHKGCCCQSCRDSRVNLNRQLGEPFHIPALGIKRIQNFHQRGSHTEHTGIPRRNNNHSFSGGS